MMTILFTCCSLKKAAATRKATVHFSCSPIKLAVKQTGNHQHCFYSYLTSAVQCMYAFSRYYIIIMAYGHDYSIYGTATIISFI